MKKFKILIAIFLIFLSVTLCSCDSKKQIQTASTMEYRVSDEISSIDDAENLDDETLKALSIVIRTKLYNGEEVFIYDNNNTETSNYFNNDSSNNNNFISSENSNNLSETKNETFNNKFYHASNNTSNQVLKTSILNNQTDNLKNKNLLNNIIITNDKESYKWEKVIKKSDLLKFLAKKNISLANVSDIKTNTDENSNIISIIIAGKEIDFNEIKTEFDLPSSKITSIKNNVSNIYISGNNIDSKNVFDIKTSKTLANNNQTYEQILNYFFDSYNIIKLQDF